MEKTEVKKLKLNATTIKSFLFRSNKKLDKIKKDKFRLIETQEKQDKIRDKEKKIESPANLKSPLSALKSFVLAGPMSILDKIKEFFGVILLGILVNNLPQIIQKIKDFFNDPFIKGTLKVFKFMGKGFYEIIKSVIMLPSSAQNKIQRETDQIKKTVDELLVTFGIIERDIDKEDNQGNKKSAPTPPTPPPLASPGSMYPPAIPPAARPPQPQRKAKGGTIQRPKAYKNGGTVTQPKKKEATQKSRTTSLSQRESGKLKKARQDMNYFENFNRAVKDLFDNTVFENENNKMFEEMVNNLKQFTDLLGVDKKTTGPGSKPGSKSGAAAGPGINLAIPVNPDEVVGTVGNTGLSGGPHIHIEDYAKPGGAIPNAVKSNILVGGLPMTNGTKTSSIGWRWHPVTGEWREHKGEDWDQNWNGKPITLTGGLKFVNYAPMNTDPRLAGYGNAVIIEAPGGKRYFLGHLGSGPKNSQKLKQKQLQLQQNQNAALYVATGKKESGEASWYGPGFQGRKTASGERFDTNEFTAAHPSLPFGTRVRVKNPANGKSVIVKINDRGPYAVGPDGKAIQPLRPHPSRVIDLSKAAMDYIGGSGVIDVELEILKAKPIPKPGEPGFVGPLPSNARASIEGLNRTPRSLSPLNNTETSMVAMMMTQPVIQPYPVPYPVPIKSAPPAPSGPPVLAGAWSDLG